MNDFHWKLVLLAIILSCNFRIPANAEEVATPNAPKDEGGCNDSDECDETDNLFDNQLQQNYQTAFLKMIQFFKTTNSILTSMNKTILNLERKIQILEQEIVNNKATLSIELQDLKNQVSNSRSRLSKLQGNKETTTEATIMPKPATAEDYLRSLNPPVKGESLNGLRAEEIAASIPKYGALSIEILNYLDSNLTDYQLYLPFGSVHQTAPTNVISKTREIFTFEQNRRGWPVGVLLYRIGDTGLSFHLYFHSGGTYGVGLLDSSATVRTIWPIKEGCLEFAQTRNSKNFRCIDRNPNYWDYTESFIVHQGSVFAKLTVYVNEKTSILKVEIFKFKN